MSSRKRIGNRENEHDFLVLVSNVDITQREVQALVLSPTRELAVQTEKTALALGNYMNVQVHACIGGRSIGEDIRKLDSPACT